MVWKVRVRMDGLQRDFGTGDADKAYKTRQGAEKRANKLRKRYAKYPTASVRVIRSVK